MWHEKLELGTLCSGQNADRKQTLKVPSADPASVECSNFAPIVAAHSPEPHNALSALPHSWAQSLSLKLVREWLATAVAAGRMDKTTTQQQP